MDPVQEDRIYDLQQELATMSPAGWETYLRGRCSGEAALQAEVLRRQRQLLQEAGTLFEEPAGGTADRAPGRSGPRSQTRTREVARGGSALAPGATLVIGRAPSCDVRLADDTVSARHARLTADRHGRYWLQDLHSRNGTFVRVQSRWERVSGEGRLVTPAEDVAFGECRMRVSDLTAGSTVTRHRQPPTR